MFIKETIYDKNVRVENFLLKTLWQTSSEKGKGRVFFIT